MPDLKQGDRVTVVIPGRKTFSGKIVGEGGEGRWWHIKKDGTLFPRGVHKSFCKVEEDQQMAANSGTLEMRVIVFKDGGMWAAQCLEHDIGAQAHDVDTLMTRLEVVLKAECKISLENGVEPFNGIDPAPARFHAMWEHRARSLEVTPTPAPK